MAGIRIWFSSHRPVAALVLWIAGLVAGFGIFESYKAAPGRQEAAPTLLGDARSESGSSPRWRLLMFVHPHCPCSKASLVELQKVLAAFPESISAEVVVVKPDSVGFGWEQGVCTTAAAALPGVRIRCDNGGMLAGHYGACTSGHVVFYGPDGHLRFSGGITRLRGHAGDNAGARSIAALLEGQSPETSTTPVYGCPLLGANDRRCTQMTSGPKPDKRLLP